jgi:hypothetical protein
MEMPERMESFGEIKARLFADLEDAVAEELIGRAASAELRMQVPQMLREQIAGRLGCDVEEVELINPRWENEGRDFRADGIRCPVPQVAFSARIVPPV